VFLDPAAPSWNSDHCFPYELELKGLGVVEVPVVDPLGGCRPERAEQIVQGVLRAFGEDSPDLRVLKKRQNTLRLLNRARRDLRQEIASGPEAKMEAVLGAADYADALRRERQSEPSGASRPARRPFKQNPRPAR
jgi:hypothetical protein